MDLLAVSTHVARRGNIRIGMPVLVIGSGPIGNGVVQVAKILGAGKTVVVDRAQLALDLAIKAGADRVVDNANQTEKEIRDKILSETEQILPLTVVDTVGTMDSFQFGLSMLGKSGTMVNVAVHDLKMDFNTMDIGSEKSVTTSCNFDTVDYVDTLKWLEEGKIKVDDWLHRIPLTDVPSTFEKLVDGQQKDIFKVCIEM
ncbi:MAG: zinc-binding dehydrogenase, partial [Proteobacteria bacterium]|nr:zinc-binding dehydrogenase [Pseudomonadota bacterium]